MFLSSDFVLWDSSSQNPSGAAVTLPLSGRVGVHHAGRVHPGPNSQRFLLHAGRGPTGQVVLDPEHLQGPDAPTAAADRPRRHNDEEKQKEEEKCRKIKKSQLCRTDRGSMFGSVDEFLWNIKNLEVWNVPRDSYEEEEEEWMRQKIKDMLRKKKSRTFILELFLCFSDLIQPFTLDGEKHFWVFQGFIKK